MNKIQKFFSPNLLTSPTEWKKVEITNMKWFLAIVYITEFVALLFGELEIKTMTTLYEKAPVVFSLVIYILLSSLSFFLLALRFSNRIKTTDDLEVLKREKYNLWVNGLFVCFGIPTLFASALDIYDSYNTGIGFVGFGAYLFVGYVYNRDVKAGALPKVPLFTLRNQT